MNAAQLIEVLKGLDPNTEIRVPYGDEPGEHDYITGVVKWDSFVLLTATRDDQEMDLGITLWAIH